MQEEERVIKLWNQIDSTFSNNLENNSVIPLLHTALDLIEQKVIVSDLMLEKARAFLFKYFVTDFSSINDRKEYKTYFFRNSFLPLVRNVVINNKWDNLKITEDTKPLISAVNFVERRLNEEEYLVIHEKSPHKELENLRIDFSSINYDYYLNRNSKMTVLQPDPNLNTTGQKKDVSSPLYEIENKYELEKAEIRLLYYSLCLSLENRWETFLYEKNSYTAFDKLELAYKALKPLLKRIRGKDQTPGKHKTNYRFYWDNLHFKLIQNLLIPYKKKGLIGTYKLFEEDWRRFVLKLLSHWINDIDTPHQYVNYWEKDRQALENCRGIWNEEFPMHKINTYQLTYTKSLTKLLSRWINKIEKFIGLGDQKICWVSLGSLSRKEANIKSDLEYMLLLEHPSENAPWVQSLLWLLEGRLLGLGESFSDNKGFFVDISGNPRIIDLLCGTAQKILEVFSINSLFCSYIKSGHLQSLLHADYLAGDPELFIKYSKARKAILFNEASFRINNQKVVSTTPKLINILELDKDPAIKVLFDKFNIVIARELQGKTLSDLIALLSYISNHEMLRKNFAEKLSGALFNNDLTQAVKEGILHPIQYVMMDLALSQNLNDWHYKYVIQHLKLKTLHPNYSQLFMHLIDLIGDWSHYQLIQIAKKKLLPINDLLKITEIIFNKIIPLLYKVVYEIIQKKFSDNDYNNADAGIIFDEKVTEDVVFDEKNLPIELKEWLLLVKYLHLPLSIQLSYYRKLPTHKLKEQYLKSIETDTEVYNALSNDGEENGYRQSERLEIEELFESIYAITTAEPLVIKGNIIIEVVLPGKIDASDQIHHVKRYLRPECGKQILDENFHIKKTEEHCAHNVARITYQDDAKKQHNLVVKEKPDNPMKDYGVFIIKKRLVGHGAAANTLVIVKVILNGKKVASYPLLISTAIGSKEDNLASLNKADKLNNFRIDPEYFTDLFIVELVLKAGDGTLPNYQLKCIKSRENKGIRTLVCIDNDRYWVLELINTKFSFLNKVELKWLSIIFCLSQMHTEPLNENSLRRFNKLNINNLLTDWITHLKIQERLYVSLCKDEEDITKLYGLINGKGFNPFFLLRDGTVSQMNLELLLLQNQFSHALTNKKPLYGGQIFKENNIKVAERYAKAFTQTNCSLEKQFSLITINSIGATTPNHGLRSRMTAYLIPQEIREEKCTLEQMEKELMSINSTNKALKEKNREILIILTKDSFSEVHAVFPYLPFGKRNAEIIKQQSQYYKSVFDEIVSHKKKYKCRKLTLLNCYFLEEKILEKLLSNNEAIVHLDFRNSHLSDEKFIGIIEKNCPQLAYLNLSNCQYLKNLSGGGKNKYCSFPNLKKLDISDNVQLETILINAPKLVKFNASNCNSWDLEIDFQEHAPLIEKIKLLNLKKMNYKNFCRMVQGLKYLKQLNLVDRSKLNSSLSANKKILVFFEQWPLFSTLMFHYYNTEVLLKFISAFEGILSDDIELNLNLRLKHEIDFQSHILTWMKLQAEIIEILLDVNANFLTNLNSLSFETAINTIGNFRILHSSIVEALCHCLYEASSYSAQLIINTFCKLEYNSYYKYKNFSELMDKRLNEDIDSSNLSIKIDAYKIIKLMKQPSSSILTKLLKLLSIEKYNVTTPELILAIAVLVDEDDGKVAASLVDEFIERLEELLDYDYTDNLSQQIAISLLEALVILGEKALIKQYAVIELYERIYPKLLSSARISMLHIIKAYPHIASGGLLGSFQKEFSHGNVEERLSYLIKADLKQFDPTDLTLQIIDIFEVNYQRLFNNLPHVNSMLKLLLEFENIEVNLLIEYLTNLVIKMLEAYDPNNNAVNDNLTNIFLAIINFLGKHYTKNIDVIEQTFFIIIDKPVNYLLRMATIEIFNSIQISSEVFSQKLYEIFYSTNEPIALRSVCIKTLGKLISLKSIDADEIASFLKTIFRDLENFVQEIELNIAIIDAILPLIRFLDNQKIYILRNLFMQKNDVKVDYVLANVLCELAPQRPDVIAVLEPYLLYKGQPQNEITRCLIARKLGNMKYVAMEQVMSMLKKIISDPHDSAKVKNAALEGLGNLLSVDEFLIHFKKDIIEPLTSKFFTQHQKNVLHEMNLNDNMQSIDNMPPEDSSDFIASIDESINQAEVYESTPNASPRIPLFAGRFFSKSNLNGGIQEIDNILTEDNLDSLNNFNDAIYQSDLYTQASELCQRQPLFSASTIKQKLINYIPQHLDLGEALSEGDCFFDAFAQALNEKINETASDVKSLRLYCDEYVKDAKNTWVKPAILKDGGNYEQYLTRIAFTAKEMENYERNGLNLGLAEWGRPSIEGRMLCERFNVELHIIEVLEEAVDGNYIMEQIITAKGSRSIEPLAKKNYDAVDIIHLVVYKNHFVPLLAKNAALLQQLPITSLEKNFSSHLNLSNSL